ncbi:uncharacterized protein LOC115721345 isoform X1 [Cannabis sativa]|uniref:uncharacterized protein LOC115721345 isoform X1 n=1 Tax=Cannabis sativa TaxID=3483 RepID=UPI0029CA52CC|nr:uncharacterized protein LOC115721345 isoform X1 [Cannabis sativa]XP_060964819.1 uncharacterized protein LOC115721345 isoform X1 [Cannabis sativa]XP_060964820.1 uncharacterized protein LOC115721345 isoform X1 [Cannabis sativa]
MEELEEQWRSEAYDRPSEFNTLEDLASLLDQVLLGQVRLLRLSSDLRSHVTTGSEDNELNEWIHQAVQSVRVRKQEGIRNCYAPNLLSGSPSPLETEIECDKKMEMAIREHKRAFARLDSFSKHKQQAAIQSEFLNEDSLPSAASPEIFDVAKIISDGDEDKWLEKNQQRDSPPKKRKEEVRLLVESSEQKDLWETVPDLEVGPWGSLAQQQRTALEMNQNVGGEEDTRPKKKTPMKSTPEKKEEPWLVLAAEEEESLVVSLVVPWPITSLAGTEPNQPRRSSPETERRETRSLVVSPEIQSVKTWTAAQAGRLKKKMVGRSFFSPKPYQVRPKPNSLTLNSALAHKRKINPMGHL